MSLTFHWFLPTCSDTSPDDGAAVATHGDLYLVWGEPVHLLAQKVEWVRALGKQHGRSLSIGVRLHVVSRHTSEQAWDEAGVQLGSIADGELEWVRAGLVRDRAGTALVGSHEDVAERISEYADLGIDHFVLSGHPHLEAARQFAEGVVPALARRGLVTP